jgi:hypothetical protein
MKFPRYHELKSRVKDLWNLGKIPRFIEILEKGLDKDLFFDPSAPVKEAIPIELLPGNVLELRQSSWIRKIYEFFFPVSHAFRITYHYEREFLDQFMPLSRDAYIGRGSYKFVYKLPWNQVLKISITKLISDPLFGSLYKQVSKNLDQFLKKDELDLKVFLQAKAFSEQKVDDLEFKFRRLALERYHYWKLKSLVPDLVAPTRFFMGMRVRNSPVGIPLINITPCEQQTLIPGKHLKEFITASEKKQGSILKGNIFSKWQLSFNSQKFGIVGKTKLKKIALDFHRLVEVVKFLADEEGLIFDLHTENIIITLPNFDVKIFDYHVFDRDLYETNRENPNPELDHIQIIEEFVKSFEL